MNIFHKRPLCLILCIMLGGFLVFSTCETFIRIALLIGAGIVLVVTAIYTAKSRKIFPIIAVCGLCVSILLSWIYFGSLFYADKNYKGEVEIVGTVTDIDSEEYTSSVYIKTETINGEKAGYKIRFRASNDELDEAWVGDEVSFTAVLVRAQSELLYSDGVGSVATLTSPVTVTERSGSKPLSARLQYMRDSLSRHFILMTDKSSGGLISALITGERSYLSDTVRLDFQRSGLTHILALSGMHLAIIALLISRLLKLLRIPKRPRLTVTLILVWAYTIFTGCPVTVVRAAIMLTVTTLMRLFSRTHDSPTSLVIAVFVIVLLSPYAIFDVSLWLSALATLGIVTGSEYELTDNTAPAIKRTLKSRFVSSFRLTMLAISATVLLSALKFGTLSVAAQIATLLISAPVEIFMILSFIMLLIFDLIPISVLVKPLGSLITKIAAEISDVRGVLVRADRPAIIIPTIILTVLLITFLVFEIKRKRLFLYSIFGVLASIFVIASALSVNDLNQETVSVSSADKQDIILTRSEGESLLISSSSYSAGSAYSVINLIENSGTLHLDKYCATHYSKNLQKELSVLLSYIHVDEVYIPIPENEDEREIEKGLKKLLSRTRTRLCYYSDQLPICFGNSKFHLIYSRKYGEGSSINAFALEYDGFLYTYLSSGSLELENSEALQEIMKDSNAIIFGSHGKLYSKVVMLDEKIRGVSKMIISSEKLFLTQECKEYYENNGCDVISHPLNVEIIIRR